MPETPEQFYERALAAADAEGRLAMPPVEDWETFPFDGALKVRPLLPPTKVDRPRNGEDAADCWRCQDQETNLIWSDDSWILSSLGRSSGLPVVVILFPREHFDIDELDPGLAAELGPMLLRVEKSIRSVGDIGRVHVCRWGDGSAHLHWWFMARPARIPQAVGSFAAIWDDIFPAVPDHIWSDNLQIVAAAMATSGGTVHL